MAGRRGVHGGIGALQLSTMGPEIFDPKLSVFLGRCTENLGESHAMTKALRGENHGLDTLDLG